MPEIRNVSPLGDIDLPLLGRTVSAGEVFEVPVSVAEALLEQTANFERVGKKPTKPKAPTIKALQAELKKRGLGTTGTKPVLAARLAAADAAPDETEASPAVVDDNNPEG